MKFLATACPPSPRSEILGALYAEKERFLVVSVRLPIRAVCRLRQSFQLPTD